MEIRYQIFKEDELFIQKFTGLFLPDDYVKYSKHISEYLASGSVKKVLIDFRDLLFGETNDVMPPALKENVDKMVAFRKKINNREHTGKKVKIVIWVDKPPPTVIVHLFVNKFSDSDYNYCSTEAKAIEMLDLKIIDKALESKIKHLEHSFISH